MHQLKADLISELDIQRYWINIQNYKVITDYIIWASSIAKGISHLFLNGTENHRMANRIMTIKFKLLQNIIQVSSDTGSCSLGFLSIAIAFSSCITTNPVVLIKVLQHDSIKLKYGSKWWLIIMTILYCISSL